MLFSRSREPSHFLYGVAGFVLATMFFLFLMLFGLFKTASAYPDPLMHKLYSDTDRDGIAAQNDAVYNGKSLEIMLSCLQQAGRLRR